VRASFDQRPAPLRVALAVAAVSALVVGCGGDLSPPPAPRFEGDAPQAQINLEAESGANGNPVQGRGSASGGAAVLLHNGGSVRIPFDLRTPGPYTLVVRYSTDGPGTRSEQVGVSIDGKPVGQFEAQNTRGPGQEVGAGWEGFVLSPPLGPIDLSRDTHTVVVALTDGDQYGIDIDGLGLTRR
jgi:hypothetical protein